MTENDQQLFSEDAALRELEELQQKIEASRVRRKEANEAFDRFVRSFERQPAPPLMREPPPAPRPPVPVAATPLPPAPLAPAPPAPAPVVAPVLPAVPAVQEVLPPAPASTPREVPRVANTLPTAPPQDRLEPNAMPALPPVFPSELPSEPSHALDLDDWDRTPASGVDAFPEEATRGTLSARDPFLSQERSVPAALTAPGRSGRRIPPVAGVAAVLAIAAVAFFALRGNSDDSPETDSAVAETPVAAPQPAAQPAASPTPPPPATPPPRAEISTLRHVWIRVTVDGQKVVERELPPDTRIPLNPASGFVVRAGDAGAVRVAIGGKDQGPVGADGRAATKAFTVPPKPIE